MRMGTSMPTATACCPRGFTTSQDVSLVPPAWRCKVSLSSRSVEVARSTVRIVSTLPEIHGRGLGLPYPRGFDARKADQCAVLRPEGDILVRLGQDSGLAGYRITQDAEAVLRPNDERVEAVEVLEALLKGLPEVQPLVHTPGQVGRGDLGVVLGFEAHPI